MDKKSKKMAEVEECEVPVVDEAYLEDSRKGGALLKIPSHTISSWGAARHSLAVEEMTDCGAGSLKSAGIPSPDLPSGSSLGVCGGQGRV